MCAHTPLEIQLCCDFLPNGVFAEPLEDSSSPQAVPSAVCLPSPSAALSLSLTLRLSNLLEISCAIWFLIWGTGNEIWKDFSRLGEERRGSTTSFCSKFR